MRIASAALIQAAIEGTQRNASFAARVRAIYQELSATSKPRPTGRRKAPEPELVPIREVPGWDPDPAAPLDPYKLWQLYGSSQLRRALGPFKMPDLVAAARQVQDQNPGTKLASKAKREAVLDFIVRYVAGEGMP